MGFERQKDVQHRDTAVKENNAAIQKKAREIAGLPEGMAFFMEGELKDVVSREVNKELNHEEEVHKLKSKA